MTLHRVFLLGLPLLPVPACAATADLAQIDQLVAGFTGAAQGAPGGATLPVDRRLRLAACKAPLSLGWHTQRRESVVVQCPDPGSWRLFVPVDAARQEAVAETPAVKPGESVTISVKSEGFAVSQPGTAVEGGAVGSWIRVRPVQGGAPRNDPLRAQVIRPGLVAIPLP